MRIANVILMHKNPEQVLRFIDRLDCDGLENWVHIDAKCKTIDPGIFSGLKNVHLVEPRIEVTWGCLNTVEAMLHCMGIIFRERKKYDYINFLSGQDYLLRPPEHFRDYIAGNYGYEFIGNRPYEESLENMKRFQEFHLNRFYPHLDFPKAEIVERAINMVLPRRKFPYPYQIRKGPQWMALSGAAIFYILDFVHDNPGFVNYFKWVHIPDEFFFQTILYNSRFKSKMRNEIFHYIDWSEHKKNPKILTTADEQKLEKSPLFFARKFDITVDHAILDILDLKNQKSRRKENEFANAVQG